ncbi:hypothetical protein O6H91_09G068100 [Diphasiastrum complanatum]|uniref:Uncharacterized protein n=1 Tax=Diphasiastrum complanatum TaxID=34168 RepID=A0ACC2CQ52_DIPCM|nr:hypothetical protein O6H91_09G068100 [Diphasiastrum complanatum]
MDAAAFVSPSSTVICCHELHVPKQQHLLFLSSSSCSNQLTGKKFASPVLHITERRRARIIVAQAFKGNDKKAKGSKQVKTGHASSGKTGNPWIEGSSEAARSKSTAKKKGNPWIENGNQTSSSSSKGKAVDKRSKLRNEAASFVGKVLVSGMMSTKEEELLQPYEIIPSPSWNTFASGNAGIWQGVGAAFSPFTAELEPIASNTSNKNVYDCSMWSIIKLIGGLEPSRKDIVHRKVFWNVENAFRGEKAKHAMVQGNYQAGKVSNLQAANISESKGSVTFSTGSVKSESGFMSCQIGAKKLDGADTEQRPLVDLDTSLGYEPQIDILEARQIKEGSLADANPLENHSAAVAVNESDGDHFGTTDDLDIMEEDHMGLEPGLAFFEDGSYSRGPLQLLEETAETSTLSQSSTFKIEHCLVRGGHTRLRVVHTIEVQEGGVAVQVLRLTIFEEEWKGPSDWTSVSGANMTLPSFAQRNRLSPHDLKGHWKVFEIDVSVVYESDSEKGVAIPNASFQHFCKETRISRQLPKMEPNTETDNNSMFWLLGGVYTYMDVTADDVLIIGVGWLGKDNTNLVMERLYGPNGSLAHVRSRSEIKVG